MTSEALEQKASDEEASALSLSEQIDIYTEDTAALYTSHLIQPTIGPLTSVYDYTGCPAPPAFWGQPVASLPEGGRLINPPWPLYESPMIDFQSWQQLDPPWPPYVPRELLPPWERQSSERYLENSTRMGERLSNPSLRYGD